MKYIQFRKPIYTHLILGTGNSNSDHLSFDFLVKVKTFTSGRGI